MLSSISFVFSLTQAYNLTVFLAFLSITGYIDLSKRRVSTEEKDKCEETFKKAKAVRILYSF